VTHQAVQVRRAASRARTRAAGADTAHSFSFGHHYHPHDTSYALLVAHNDDVLAPGAGYELHEHRDVEIVTWVLAGVLVHHDVSGRPQVLLPGQVQRLSAGRGVRHAETNHAHLVDPARAPGPVRFVQSWVVPDAAGGEPAYERSAVDASRWAHGLVPVVSGRPQHLEQGALQLRQRDAALHVGRLAPGRDVVLPDAPYLHVFVGSGEVELDGAGRLAEGDAARLTAVGARRVTPLRAAEVLVWEMHADLHGTTREPRPPSR
jgi:redox-sensitive bicupin YhaK (pirin superfamily)